ncbi:enoyl-CoA hydratase/isomerase family protein [Candidatus Albibeggiatoa sp. nov. NOAA]|uniref:enoyl-CoA hydratase/isomerase family protein n=1 Tax=Candidatus Albibeggiatoa sp. nov. NOAA TaxID=3162724 RepID=UPI0033030C9A|nr:enoyl-CoA hydratase/isomerase family protein [Thiotrichaceae bacterium]
MNLHEEVQVPLKFNPETMSTFAHEFQKALDNTKTKVIVLTGNDNYFSIGMDLEYLTTQLDDGFITEAGSIFKQVKHSHKPVIAKVENNVIAGGLELLSLSDFIVTTTNATFCLPEASFNITPSIVMSSLTDRMRAKDIKYMVLTSEVISAEKALEIGLVDDVVEPDDIDAKIMAWVKKLKRVSQSVVQDSKFLLSQKAEFDDLLDMGCQMFEAKLNDPDTMQRLKQYLEDIRMFNEEYADD